MQKEERRSPRTESWNIFHWLGIHRRGGTSREGQGRQEEKPERMVVQRPSQERGSQQREQSAAERSSKMRTAQHPSDLAGDPDVSSSRPWWDESLTRTGSRDKGRKGIGDNWYQQPSESFVGKKSKEMGQ